MPSATDLFNKPVIVPPDGPVPCDLAIVGEAPGAEEVRQLRGFCGPSGKLLWDGEYNLISGIVGRSRDSCYVTNVVKFECRDTEWADLPRFQKLAHYSALRTELRVVQPKVVLAFGRRACIGLVPDFKSINFDHGKARIAADGYIVLPLWHPAAFLRGNREVIGLLAEALSHVPDLLEDGLPDDWPQGRGWGEKKKAKCNLCGGLEHCIHYEDEERQWWLCMPHAWATHKWLDPDQWEEE